jgi:hypothetical protein
MIVIHRGDLPRSEFQQELETGGYTREDLTRPVLACIIREVREHLAERGFDVISLDVRTGDIEVESDFFGLRLRTPLRFSYFTKSRWESVKLYECRNPVENGDQEFPDITTVSDPNQITLFRK